MRKNQVYLSHPERPGPAVKFGKSSISGQPIITITIMTDHTIVTTISVIAIITALLLLFVLLLLLPTILLRLLLPLVLILLLLFSYASGA